MNYQIFVVHYYNFDMFEPNATMMSLVRIAGRADIPNSLTDRVSELLADKENVEQRFLLHATCNPNFAETFHLPEVTQITKYQ